MSLLVYRCGVLVEQHNYEAASINDVDIMLSHLRLTIVDTQVMYVTGVNNFALSTVILMGTRFAHPLCVICLISIYVRVAHHPLRVWLVTLLKTVPGWHGSTIILYDASGFKNGYGTLIGILSCVDRSRCVQWHIQGRCYRLAWL
jgi:hypothetical protein